MKRLYSATSCGNSARVQKCASRLPYKTHLIAWSSDEDDARMLVGILSPMNSVMNDQLTLKLVDVCFDNALQICKIVAELCKNFED